MTRAWLAPLGALYGAAVAAKDLAYDPRWLRAKRLRWPVVSVGNLSVGGSGKTPLAIRLAELLAAEGIAVAVLSRGYGRTSRATERVDPDGDAARFGDEPLLIARRAGVPVYVGASRYEAGLLAETNPISQAREVGHPAFMHLLDDGFQHRQLARAVDIVVVHRSDFAEKLLPAGRLREPLSALRRADFLVLREEDANLEPKLRERGATTPIWWMRRSLALPPELDAGSRIVAFCGIARPEEFFAALAAANLRIEAAVRFADHHRYSTDDIADLVATAKKIRAEAFLATEKDAVKLTPALLQRLEAVAPVRVARLEVTLRDEAEVVRQLLAKLPPLPR